MRLVFAAFLVVLMGCKIDVPSIKIEPRPSEEVPVNFTCSAVANGGLPAESGETVGVLVSVSGTYGPFSSLEISGDFSGSAEVFRSYKNNTTSQIVVDDSIKIKDGMGFEKSCDFKVTVFPASPTTDLSCVLTSDKSLVSTSESVNLTMTASGGEKPYTFGDLESTGVVTALTKKSDIHATAAVSFATSGLKAISAKVVDARGTIQMCSTVVEVRPFTVPIAPVCTVTTTFNPSFLGESVIVTATPGVSTGLGPATLYAVQSMWNASMAIVERVSDTQAEVRFYNSGYFPVVATVEYLLSGHRVQCTTWQFVSDPYWY